MLTVFGTMLRVSNKTGFFVLIIFLRRLDTGSSLRCAWAKAVKNPALSKHSSISDVRRNKQRFNYKRLKLGFIALTACFHVVYTKKQDDNQGYTG
jgi:hypothetical protein